MSTNEKLKKKFQQEPLPKEIPLDDLMKYLELYGFKVEKDKGKGSHYLATHPKLKYPFPIPSKNGKIVKFVYLKELNKIIKSMEE